MDAHYLGNLRLAPNPANPLATLVVESKRFSFVDKKGVQWIAKPGDIVGGAHIPSILKWIVGGSYQEPYLRAAVLHDIYCESKERTWQATDNMFFEALLASGVGIIKSHYMWAAVWAYHQLGAGW